MYPGRYQLPELTAHVVGLLERRRAGFEKWDESVEQALTEEAKHALADAGKQFAELADDKPYWQRMEHALLTVALPRYFKLAKEQQALEERKYGLWRGGDLISRIAYAAIGLVLGILIWRTPIPDWMEPLPLLLFLLGPLIPDLQEGLAKRRYAKSMARLVEEMGAEQTETGTYLPLGVDEPAPVDELAGSHQPSAAGGEREKS